ncbi:MAG: DUF1501 domain-containing protein [Pirellulales bacterium]
MSRTFLNTEYTRRDLMRLSLASALGVSCSGWLPSLARAAAERKNGRACILLWMNGGPSQTDTFDPKPDHDNGGPVKTIQTAVPGIQISEYLPGVSKEMKNLAIIRSLTSREGDHGRATQLMLTGYRPQPATDYPSLGSLIAKELGDSSSELPNYISLSPVRFAQAGGPGFLGPQFAPLVVSGNSSDTRARANLNIENLAPPAEVGLGGMKSRLQVLDLLQSEFSSRYESEASRAHRANVERTARMIESQAKNAFKLDEEPDEIREAYGRNRFGQGCLLARRLVERGVPFVEVTLAQVPGAGAAWDTHANNFNSVRALCEVLDPAWSSLVRELRERGLLDNTLVVWMGEFGRTPQINPNTGRDHFPGAWTTVLGGAGIRTGQVVGNTGKDGMAVVDRPVTVPEFYATLCAALGIDYAKQNFTPQGRPIALVDEGGKPLAELVG